MTDHGQHFQALLCFKQKSCDFISKYLGKDMKKLIITCQIYYTVASQVLSPQCTCIWERCLKYWTNCLFSEDAALLLGERPPTETYSRSATPCKLRVQHSYGFAVVHLPFEQSSVADFLLPKHLAMFMLSYTRTFITVDLYMYNYKIQGISPLQLFTQRDTWCTWGLVQ